MPAQQILVTLSLAKALFGQQRTHLANLQLLGERPQGHTTADRPGEPRQDSATETAAGLTRHETLQLKDGLVHLLRLLRSLSPAGWQQGRAAQAAEHRTASTAGCSGQGVTAHPPRHGPPGLPRSQPWLQLPSLPTGRDVSPDALAGGSEEPFQMEGGAAAPHRAGHTVSIRSLLIHRQLPHWQRREALQLSRVQRWWPNTLFPATAVCQGRRALGLLSVSH